MTAYTANRMALESKLNRQYESQIEDILSKVVGEGKVIAKVSVAKVVKPLIPLLIVMIVVLFLVTYFPQLSLWLPGVFGL